MDKLQEDFISSYTLHKPVIEDFSNKDDIIEEFNTDYGLVLANIPEHKRTYSSIWGNNRIGTGHARSMIDSPQGWSSRHNTVGHWIKMDMGADRNIGGIIIQGRRKYNQFVNQFHIKLQRENGKFIGTSFNQYVRKTFYPRGRRRYTRSIKILSGIFYKTYQNANVPGNRKKNIMFNKVERARYVYIYPTKWSRHMSLRSDVYTTKSAKYKLITGNHPESSRTYSSIHPAVFGPTVPFNKSMITSKSGWVSKSRHSGWLIIDMKLDKKIGGVIIGSGNGRLSNTAVTKINVYTKGDGGVFIKQLINAQAVSNPSEIIKIEFNGIIITRYVKIEVVEFMGHTVMRADVLIVDDKTNELISDRRKLHNVDIKKYQSAYDELTKKHKLYLDSINDKNKGKNKKYDKLSLELKEIKGKLDLYKKGATGIRGSILKTFSDEMPLDKEQLNSYFNNSYQFFNDISSDIGLDNQSLKIGTSALDKNKQLYNRNKSVLDDLDNYIHTHTRQKNLQIDYLFKGEDNSIFIKLVTICLLLVVFVYILSYFKVVDVKQSSYVAYGVFILFGGIALLKIFKTLTNKNKSTDNKPIKNKSTVKKP